MCVCVCMVILGIETAVAIVTHQTTCCALISAPWTARSLDFILSLSHPHDCVTQKHTARPRNEGNVLIMSLNVL